MGGFGFDPGQRGQQSSAAAKKAQRGSVALPDLDEFNRFLASLAPAPAPPPPPSGFTGDPGQRVVAPPPVVRVPAVNPAMRGLSPTRTTLDPGQRGAQPSAVAAARNQGFGLDPGQRGGVSSPAAARRAAIADLVASAQNNSQLDPGQRLRRTEIGNLAASAQGATMDPGERELATFLDALAAPAPAPAPAPAGDDGAAAAAAAAAEAARVAAEAAAAAEVERLRLAGLETEAAALAAQQQACADGGGTWVNGACDMGGGGDGTGDGASGDGAGGDGGGFEYTPVGGGDAAQETIATGAANQIGIVEQALEERGTAIADMVSKGLIDINTARGLYDEQRAAIYADFQAEQDRILAGSASERYAGQLERDRDRSALLAELRAAGVNPALVGDEFAMMDEMYRGAGQEQADYLDAMGRIGRMSDADRAMMGEGIFGGYTQDLQSRGRELGLGSEFEATAGRQLARERALQAADLAPYLGVDPRAIASGLYSGVDIPGMTEAARGRDWQTGERLGGQDWQTGERLGGQDWRTGEADLDRKSRVSEGALDRAIRESQLAESTRQFNTGFGQLSAAQTAQQSMDEARMAESRRQFNQGVRSNAAADIREQDRWQQTFDQGVSSAADTLGMQQLAAGIDPATGGYLGFDPNDPYAAFSPQQRYQAMQENQMPLAGVLAGLVSTEPVLQQKVSDLMGTLQMAAQGAAVTDDMLISGLAADPQLQALIPVLLQRQQQDWRTQTPGAGMSFTPASASAAPADSNVRDGWFDPEGKAAEVGALGPWGNIMRDPGDWVTPSDTIRQNRAWGVEGSPLDRVIDPFASIAGRVAGAVDPMEKISQLRDLFGWVTGFDGEDDEG